MPPRVVNGASGLSVYSCDGEVGQCMHRHPSLAFRLYLLSRGPRALWIFLCDLNSKAPNHQSEDSTKRSFQAWCWWPVLSLFPVPFTQEFVLSTSTFLSHSLSFLQSLRKKLMILQETLSLPPVTNETVSRLVFERFVTLLG